MTAGNISVVDIIKSLDRSNCGDCGLPSCMAFAAMALRGQKPPTACPYLKPEIIKILEVKNQEEDSVEVEQEKMLAAMKSEIENLDFEEAAKRTEATLKNEHLEIRCLGKIFTIDQQGNMYSDAHIIPWLHIPVLQYLLHAQNADLTGRWRTFNELEGAEDWKRFFAHQCQRGMHQMADAEPDLFFDIVDLFGEDYTLAGASATTSKILYPLPKVPVVISYQEPDGDFESVFNLFFDQSTVKNLPPQFIYQLIQGMVQMFRKIISRHGN